MLNTSKQSGAKATGSFEKHFNRSLFQLTVIYVITLVAILFISGAVTYSAFSNRIGRRFDGFLSPIAATQNANGGAVIIPNPDIISDRMPTADEVRTDLTFSLILVNGALALLAGYLSYWLAKVTLRPIKEAYERQQRFLADASHELRTPLSILQIDLETELSDSSIKERTRERAVSNLEEVQRMGNLVGDLLTLSKLDENNKQLHLVYTDIKLSEMLAGIAKRLEPLAKSNQVKIGATVKDSNLVAHSNEELLSSALINLAKNAIFYNKPDGAVELKAEAKADGVQLTVLDTGIGMSAEDLENVFNRFYRIDKSRSRQTGGNGLGLSIAQAAIEKIGGTITIQSAQDKGTIVEIFLPNGKLDTLKTKAQS